MRFWSAALLPLCFAFVGLTISTSATAQLSAGSPELIKKNLVDIGGGRRLNIVCIGSGAPTVVFEQERCATFCIGRKFRNRSRRSREHVSMIVL